MMADAAPSAAGGWAITVFAAVATALLAWDTRRFWRGPHKVWDGPPQAWDPFGAAYWHGFTRCIPLGAALAGLVFLPGGIGIIVGGTAGVAILLAAFLGLCVVGGLMLSVFFLGRPHWCVPPHRRHEPGALAEFAADRRRRAQERRAAQG
jgi:hypothetical protein